jgi:hypothetical protein
MTPAAALLDFDPAAALERLRRGDPDELARAYRRVFSGPEGRFVLAHILAEAGVGQIFGPGLTSDARHYAQGQHDGALAIMNRADHDQLSVVMMVQTDNLEGIDHDRSDPGPNGSGPSGPDPRAVLD